MCKDMLYLYIFAPVLHAESFRTKDNIPSLPLHDAHLGGFFMPNF